MRAGRYGPYVNQGKVNATLPKTLKPEDVTLEQALELIVAKGGASPKKASPEGAGQEGRGQEGAGQESCQAAKKAARPRRPAAARAKVWQRNR